MTGRQQLKRPILNEASSQFPWRLRLGVAWMAIARDNVHVARELNLPSSGHFNTVGEWSLCWARFSTIDVPMSISPKGDLTYRVKSIFIPLFIPLRAVRYGTTRILNRFLGGGGRAFWSLQGHFNYQWYYFYIIPFLRSFGQERIIMNWHGVQGGLGKGLQWGTRNS